MQELKAHVILITLRLAWGSSQIMKMNASRQTVLLGLERCMNLQQSVQGTMPVVHPIISIPR
jgi:TRAP-type C4-dicarboxylate transport system permease small subunit